MERSPQTGAISLIFEALFPLPEMCKNSKQKIKAEHFLYIYTHRHSHIQGCKCSLPRSPSYLTLARLSSSRGWKFEMDLRQKYMLWFIMSIFQGKSGLCFYWTECIQLQQHLFFFPNKVLLFRQKAKCYALCQL